MQVNKQDENALQKMITIYELIDTKRITSINDLKQYLKKAIEDVRHEHYKMNEIDQTGLQLIEQSTGLIVKTE